MGVGVGAGVGTGVGTGVEVAVGAAAGTSVAVGDKIGVAVGTAVGAGVGVGGGGRHAMFCSAPTIFPGGGRPRKMRALYPLRLSLQKFAAISLMYTSKG